MLCVLCSGWLFPTLQHHPGPAPQQDGSQHELPDRRHHRLCHRRHLPRHLHRVNGGLRCQVCHSCQIYTFVSQKIRMVNVNEELDFVSFNLLM